MLGVMLKIKCLAVQLALIQKVTSLKVSRSSSTIYCNLINNYSKTYLLNIYFIGKNNNQAQAINQLLQLDNN